MTRVSQHKLSQEVAKWNAAHPVGTPVRYWRGKRGDGPGGSGRTRSPAWVLGGHTPCVMVEGTSGAIALTHVERLDGQEDSGGGT